jgi:hypothetical protein
MAEIQVAHPRDGQKIPFILETKSDKGEIIIGTTLQAIELNNLVILLLKAHPINLLQLSPGLAQTLSQAQNKIPPPLKALVSN